jgi:hemerythrin-like domain-containing protein
MMKEGTAMPIQIGQRPDHGFDEPLGLLSDCHRRILHFLNVLATVAKDAGGGPLSPSFRQALEGALRYFAIAAPRHTQDEEVSLFPRLREMTNPALGDALAALDALEQDHRDADARHAAVDDLARRWMADDALPDVVVEELRGHLAHLTALYQRHITIEDQQIFPAAARALDAAQLKQIGGEMAARRNIRADAPVPH